MRVAVLGAGGRMGESVCEAVREAPDLQLVAAVDPFAASTLPGSASSPESPSLRRDISAVAEAEAAVAVDFTVASSALENAEWCAANGVHLVIGTTGLGAAGTERLGELFPPQGPLGCVVAANFAIGAVLMMRFAEMAAPWFDTAEIVELHHDAKVDAPSGTALATAERMAAASGEWGADPTETEVLPGARGGVGPGGIRVHSVRMRGMVAHQEVILGASGQTLTIRHDSLDRRSFMPGILAAVRRVASRPGLTVGLESILF
ncbi:MAG: 4-hydroxy-tetrahydrodipicolinate reductase [Acidimicrobiales bacterium]